MNLKVSDLKTHPKNDYYFDDIAGEKWEKLLESIKKNGVRTPIIVTDDMVIVSGNQRVRACKELGISIINAEVEHYASEDDVIRDLIEINVRQRGVIDDSEKKQGRRFKFLQEYYGIEHGNNQHNRTPNNSESSMTQEQLASEFGISVDTMNNYIKLSEMIPEMQELLESGTITKTTALSIIKKLSPDEQKQLAESIVGESKVSGAEVQKYIDRIKSLEEQRKSDETRYERKVQQMQQMLDDRPVRKVEVEKEVIPADYEELKEESKRLDGYRRENANLRAEYESMADKWKRAEAEKERIVSKMNEPEEKLAADLKGECIFFCSGVRGFLEKYGGYRYLRDELKRLPQVEQDSYRNAVNAIREWADSLLNEVTVEVDE